MDAVATAPVRWPVTTKVLDPGDVPGGMANAKPGKLPFLPVLVLPRAVAGTSQFMNTGSPAPKPTPSTVRNCPTVPLLGLTTICGTTEIVPLRVCPLLDPMACSP